MNITSTLRSWCLGLVLASFALISVIGQTVNPRQNLEPDGRSRTFNLYLHNQANHEVTFTVSNNLGWSCADSPLRREVYGPIPPGGQVTVWIARVQGNGCDGEQGQFALTTSDFGSVDYQVFTFSNDGRIGLGNTPNRFDGKLSGKRRSDGSYTYTISAVNRLPSPIDERLTKPRNYIAYDSGAWARLDAQTTAKIEKLRFSQTLPWPVHYESCFGHPLFHPQHMKRLPNKDGKAYFMISGSRAHNGYITLVETYPRLLDPVTDLIRPPSNGGAVGKFIWQDVYTGVFNETYNPIGNWNHPAKITVMGGVMLVVAQNWSEGTGIDGCTGSTSNPYQRGTSEDAILFYDVRDSSQPVYWGIMTATELKIPLGGRDNGLDDSFNARLISVVRFLYHSHRGVWEITVGGGGEWNRDYTTWETDTVSPNIEDWTLVAGAGTGNKPRVRTSVGSEHGDDFDSYQRDEDRAISVPKNGTMRSMWFGASNNGQGGGEADGFTFGSLMNTGNLVDQGSKEVPNMGSLGRDRDWTSESLYITRKGEPIAYTVENDNEPSGGTDNGDAYLWQVYDTRNFAVNQKPHPVTALVSNTFDSGLGSLREAIAYGGSITFAPSLSGQTIRLTTGPLVAYLQDVEIDASMLPGGIIVSSQGFSSLFQVQTGVRATLRSVTFQDGGNRSDARFEHAIINRGSLELFGCVVSDNAWGGLSSLEGHVFLQNCTFTGNRLQSIRNGEASTMVVRHCTVVGNIMLGGASAVSNLGTMSLENSIVADNQNVNGQSDTFGVYSTAGTNFIGGDPRLGPLARNGARVETMEPLADSPAINAAVGSNAVADALGRMRPIGFRRDLGAVEAIVVTVKPSSDLSHFSLSGQSLSWDALPGAEFEVWLDSGTGFASVGKTDSTSLALPELKAETSYQWRVDVILDGRTYLGKPQSFTSRGPLVVTTLVDENDPQARQGMGESLRETLREATQGEFIQFAANLSGGTIWLDGQPLTIDKDVTIDAAPLPDRLTINALGKHRVFEISGPNTIELKGLRIANGFAPRGAGIFNDGSTLTLSDCRFIQNEASDQGGGVYNANAGNVTATTGTVFDQNFAREGGGIYNETSASFSVDRATFIRNQAFDGGGVYNKSPSLSIKAASFSSNGAENAGGALFNEAANGLAENTTFSQNSSAAGEGGAVSNKGQGTLTLRHCTIAANVGAGVFNETDAGLILDNSIVSGNFDLNNDPFDFQGSYSSVGANLLRISNGSTLLDGPTPLTSDPLLGSLRSGGMKLLVGSPAINGGVVTADTPSSDQERSFRPHGPAPDLGALESRLSADVDLLWLTTSAGPLSPRFETSTTNYTANVPSSFATAALRAAKGHSGQTLSVRINDSDYSTVGDKEASDELPLNVGANNLEVRVTSASGTVNRTFNIGVVRGSLSSDNIGLASLTSSVGSLLPTFDFATTAYHATVPNSTESTTVTAVAARAGTRLEIRSASEEYLTLASDAPSDPIALTVGANPIDLRVIGEGDSILTQYTLTISRQAPDPSNANLTSLALSAGELRPGFAPGNSFYRLTVPAEVAETAVTSAADQAGASIQVRVNGGTFSSVPSSTASEALPLATGENYIQTMVTAPDGTTVQSYTVIVTREDERIEWASAPGNNNSFTPAVSADGRFVVYSSRASNLVADDTNDTDDIFVYDRSTQAIERVSVNDAGEQGNFASVNPSISADGRYVAFESEATKLVPNDNNGQSDRSRGADIFVYDRTSKTIERVSLTENGEQVNQASRNPSISGDGRYIAFSSGGNNLIKGFKTGNTNVYVRDRVENTTIGVSVPFSVIPSNRSSVNPVISEDGNFVAFEFSAGLSDPRSGFRYRDIYLFNRTTRAVERITGSKVGQEADKTESELPVISADGRYIAFQSNLEDLDFYDTNGKRDVFVYDRLNGVTRRVSKSFDGVEERFQDSIKPAISGDGRFVAFESKITNFVKSDTNERGDVFVRNIETGEMILRSSNPDGTQGNGNATHPALSSDGSVVTFRSEATNLGTDGNSGSHVFAISTVPPAASSVGELASLTSNLGTLSPGFSPSVTSYTVDVDAGRESATLRLIPADPGMTLNLQVNSGGFTPLESTIATVPLLVGANVVEIMTIAADGTSGFSYVLTINRAASNNAALAELFLATSNGFHELNPGFRSATTAYTATVSNETESLKISARADDPQATVSVNGTILGSPDSGSSIPLTVGSNNITIEVTAADLASTQTYSVVVNRVPSSDATLLQLTPSVEPSSGILPFNSNRTDYSMSVDNAISIIAFAPEARHPAAQISINGQAVNSGSPSNLLNLTVGSNPISVLVTAEDGVSTMEYFVNVFRAEVVQALGNNANLSFLLPSNGSLNPGLSPDLGDYDLIVDSETATLTLTPISVDASAVITINGNPVNSGTPSAPIALHAGVNVINVLVVAEDGVTTKNYTVTATRIETSTSIEIRQSNGTIILIFEGTLESAPTVNGPYSPVDGATSPYAFINQEDARFFQVR